MLATSVAHAQYEFVSLWERPDHFPSNPVTKPSISNNGAIVFTGKSGGDSVVFAHDGQQRTVLLNATQLNTAANRAVINDVGMVGIVRIKK